MTYTLAGLTAKELVRGHGLIGSSVESSFRGEWGGYMPRFFAFQSFLGIITALLLGACGGGSSGSSSPPPPPPPTATHFSVTAPPSANVGTVFPLTVTALDASNHVVTGYSGAVHFTSTDAQAVLPANSALAQGTATLSATLKSSGGYTITGTDTAIPSLTGTSRSIHIPSATSRFQNTAPMGTARVYHTATFLGGGTVLIAGGTDGTVALSSTELFDPSSGSFTPSGEMHSKRERHTATLLKNGQVLIAGGGDITSPSVQAAELFTPGTGAFAPTGSMNNARRAHTATLLNDGRVLVTGGWDASGNVRLNTAELFDPSTNTFALTGNLRHERAYHNAALLSNGMVLITGDSGESELFDPLTKTFALTACCNYLPSEQGTATSLNDGNRVLIIEFRIAPPHHPNGAAQLYDFNNGGTFAFVGGPLTDPGRSRHTATLRKDGTVLVAGGDFVPIAQLILPPPVTATPSAALFDPVSKIFVPTDDMAVGREWHTATLLTNGDVLITGGVDASHNPLAAAELYH